MVLDRRVCRWENCSYVPSERSSSRGQQLGLTNSHDLAPSPATHCALALCVIAAIMLIITGAVEMRLIAVQAMEIMFVITSSPLSRGECSSKMITSSSARLLL